MPTETNAFPAPTGEVKGMHVIRWAVFAGEGQVVLDQRADIEGSRIVKCDLALDHAQTLLRFHAPGLSIGVTRGTRRDDAGRYHDDAAIRRARASSSGSSFHIAQPNHANAASATKIGM